MKKKIALLLALVMILSLAACCAAGCSTYLKGDADIYSLSNVLGKNDYPLSLAVKGESVSEEAILIKSARILSDRESKTKMKNGELAFTYQFADQGDAQANNEYVNRLVKTYSLNLIKSFGNQVDGFASELGEHPYCAVMTNDYQIQITGGCSEDIAMVSVRIYDMSEYQ